MSLCIKYKVCILAAGKGSRMKYFCETFSKALIPIKGKPAICHIIEKFPENVEIVIPVGYKKETIKTYLNYSYPERKITVVDIDKWDGPGSGPGYSLLCCKEQLQCQFIQFAADTIVKEGVPAPERNWIGVSQVLNTKPFCSVSVNKGKVMRLDDKVETNNKYAFIGLFGIKDYQYFWEELEDNKQLVAGEVQVSNGLTSLIGRGLYTEKFTWFDVGTPEAYKHTSMNFPHGKSYSG